jgi:hypothetical protein
MWKYQLISDNFCSWKTFVPTLTRNQVGIVAVFVLVVGFTTIYAISAYHHWCCEFESRSGRGVLHTTLCDKVCQWLATSRWFSPGFPISSTNKTDRHDITEILLKVALNAITHNHISWSTSLISTLYLYVTQGLVFLTAGLPILCYEMPERKEFG